MFRALVVSFTLFASAPVIACPIADAAAYQASLDQVNHSEGTKASFAVAGMTCGSCSGKVAKALEGIEGVLAAAVDYQTGMANVAFDAAKTNPAALLTAIQKTGFEATAKDDSKKG
jgi:copper chaperone CopZ